MRRAAVAFGALLASTLVAGAPLRPIADGDRITGIGVYVSQQDGKLMYSRIGEVTYTVRIDAAGNRRYVDPHGSSYWVYGRHFKRLLFQGRDLAPDEQLELLPPDGRVAPGMAWEVPAHRTRAVCGSAEARFKASAEKGPDVPIRVDGTEVPVPTVRISYEAPLRCGERAPFLRTIEVLFSSALYEILSTTTVNYDGPARGALNLGDQGRGWRVHSIATSGGK